MCELYIANRTKFMIVCKQNNAAKALSIKNDMSTDINCRIIIFCSSSVYCVTSLNLLKCFRFENDNTASNRLSIWIFHSVLIVDFFRFLKKLIREFFWTSQIKFEIILIATSMHHVNTRIIIFFNNWCNIFTNWKRWTFNRAWLHAKFLII